MATDFNNPWGPEGNQWPPKWMEEDNALEQNAIAQVTLPTFSADMEGLASAAEALAGISLVMDYYSHFEQGTYGFFFSPNGKLESATKRPTSFSTWEDWPNLAANQRKTLAVLGGFKEDTTNVIKNDSDLKKLKAAYKKWPKELWSIWWANDYGGTWTCNIFVGDALYLWKKKSIVKDNRHYYAPSEISKGQGPFKKLAKDKVERGAIVLFGTHHMEIVTSRNHNTFFDDDFCSIGAGRGSRSATGIEKCDDFSSETREVENSDNSFYTL